MFILNPYTKVKLPLVLEIDTTKSGVTPSNGFQIPANAPSEIYSYKVDWGDGTRTSGHTGVASHTYAVGGIYQVKIYGKFPRMFFNNGGDRQKLLKVLDWGEINYSANQDNAFWGCNNLDYIAKDDINAWYNGIVSAGSMFRNCPLTTIPDNMTLDVLAYGYYTFATAVHQGLTSLPDGMTLSNLTNGERMFYVDSGNGSLTSLPDGMTLASLTTGVYMFWGNSLTSFPSGMALASLTNGNSMFYNNSLTSLPDGMTLSSLTNGTSMFYNNSLTSLPDGMTLSSLTNGNSMFNGNSLTSLPDGMVLANLTNGNSMFWNNNLTSLPDGMVLANLTTGTNMFNGNSLTSLPDGMTLANLTNGGAMFQNNSLTALPIGMTLSNLTTGTSMFRANNLTNVDNLTLTSCVDLSHFVRDNPNFNGQINVGMQVLTSINALGWGNKWSQDMSDWVFSPNCSFGNTNFSPSLSNSTEFTNEHWGKLLIRVNALCGAGSGRTAAKVLGVRNTVKYPASAATARQALIDDGWDIRDGGAE